MLLGDVSVIFESASDGSFRCPVCRDLADLITFQVEDRDRAYFLWVFNKVLLNTDFPIAYLLWYVTVFKLVSMGKELS